MKKKRRPSAGRDFLRATRFKFLDPSGQQKGLRPPPPFFPPRQGAKVVDLPPHHNDHVSDVTLVDAIDNRKSVREFLEDQSVSLEALSWLLWSSQGVKRVDDIDVYRTVPSAGARHPFETFILANRVESLPQGLYRYLGPEHKLETSSEGPELGEAISAACLQPELVQQSAVTFIWVAVAGRMTWRYSDRAFRYILMEAGHVAQNLYLAVEAVDCRTCSSAAFDDDKINQVLGLDGNDLFVTYLGCVGR